MKDEPFHIIIVEASLIIWERWLKVFHALSNRMQGTGELCQTLRLSSIQMERGAREAACIEYEVTSPSKQWTVQQSPVEIRILSHIKLNSTPDGA